MSYAGLAVTAASAIAGGIQRGIANKKSKEMLANRPTMQSSGTTEKAYALAQNMYNATMPGTQSFMNTLERNKAQQIATAERAGENPLLAAAAATTQANEASGQLAGQQAAWKQQGLSNVMSAGQAVEAEKERLFNWNEAGKWEAAMGQQAAAAQNTANTIKDFGQFGMGIANMSAAGAFNRTQNPNTQNNTIGATGLTNYSPFTSGGVWNTMTQPSPYNVNIPYAPGYTGVQPGYTPLFNFQAQPK